jgi:ADP-heptose:LPS heptosyltransferase
VRAAAASADRVTMLCSPAGAPAARRLPGVDDVLVARLPWIDARPETVARHSIDSLVDAVHRLGCDEAMICTSFHQSPLATALVLRMAGVSHVGAISVDYPGSLLDVRHHCDDDLHEVERALSLANAMGYVLPAGDDASLQLYCAPEHLPAGYVVVHPGASVPARTWSPDRWEQAVAALGAQGHRVLVTGTEAERALTARVAAADPDARDDAGRSDLDGFIRTLARADVVVTGNTGPAHLAAAVGTPVVSVFPPTVPAARWRPWQVPHVLLGDHDIPCAGCRAQVCPRGDHRCVQRIPTGAVVDAVAQLMPIVSAR